MVLLRLRAWHKTWEEMGKVKRIRFDDDGNVTTVLFMGEILGVNAKIDEFELMQSTGLLDKNGKEIFEGDILKVANNDSSWFEVVKYDHEKAMFISKEVNLKYEVPETPLYDLFSPYPFKVEVIGNIWENPDLLGTKLGRYRTTLEELITTRNKYQRKLEDKNAYRELCETVGKNNATANREWLRRKIKDLDKQISELSGL